MPKPPFSYASEDVVIQKRNRGGHVSWNTDNSRPGKKVSGRGLVTGSGPQDRDETIMHHKPFLVIADHLSRNGIAVLRYDDRGVGKSGGDLLKPRAEDFAQDASAAIEFLASEMTSIRDVSA